MKVFVRLFWQLSAALILYALLTTLNHLREWIYPAGYNSYKNKNKLKYTPEEKIHSQLYQNENYKTIKQLCNNSKHFNDSGIGKKTEILNGLITGFNGCGDRIGQRNYLVNDKNLRDMVREVFGIYKEYFA